LSCASSASATACPSGDDTRPVIVRLPGQRRLDEAAPLGSVGERLRRVGKADFLAKAMQAPRDHPNVRTLSGRRQLTLRLVERRPGRHHPLARRADRRPPPFEIGCRGRRRRGGRELDGGFHLSSITASEARVTP
jgi:hypothetical protein